MTEKELAIELLKSMLAAGRGNPRREDSPSDIVKESIRLAESFERQWRLAKNR
jgi:hypothetical protein